MNDYLLSFGGYDWLWKDDKDEAYDDFMSKNPSLDHYEAKLKTFSATEDEIGKREKIRYDPFEAEFQTSTIQANSSHYCFWRLMIGYVR